jgi:hypothetical protein
MWTEAEPLKKFRACVAEVPMPRQCRARTLPGGFVFALLTGAPYRIGDMAQYSENRTCRRKFGAIGSRQF